MAEFSIAYAITNGHEGGWQNDPSDPGNDRHGLGTWRGMASAKQPKWKGWPIIRAEIAKLGPQPAYGTAAYRAWVKRLNPVLSANEALIGLLKDYYRVNFWDVNRLGDLRSQGAANHIYDHGINRGTGTAAILLQKTLGVMADGQIGPVTIAAANKIPDHELTEMYRKARRRDYVQLVENNPKLAQYKDTWLERC